MSATGPRNGLFVGDGELAFGGGDETGAGAFGGGDAGDEVLLGEGSGAGDGAGDGAGGDVLELVDELLMPEGIIAELICSTDRLNGRETTDFTKLAESGEPSTAEPKATSPELKSVMFTNPICPVA